MKTSLPPGIRVGSVTFGGQEQPAFIFSHSRAKQVLSVFLGLILILGLGGMYMAAESARLPVFGINPPVTRGIALFTMCLLMWAEVVIVRMLLRPVGHLAVTPAGIQVSALKVFDIPWANIHELAVFRENGQERIGLLIIRPEEVPCLINQIKAMKAARSLTGWDWAFSVGLHVAANWVPVALEYYFWHPDARAEIGTQGGWAHLGELVRQGWKAAFEDPGRPR